VAPAKFTAWVPMVNVVAVRAPTVPLNSAVCLSSPGLHLHARGADVAGLVAEAVHLHELVDRHAGHRTRQVGEDRLIIHEHVLAEDREGGGIPGGVERRNPALHLVLRLDRVGDHGLCADGAAALDHDHHPVAQFVPRRLVVVDPDGRLPDEVEALAVDRDRFLVLARAHDALGPDDRCLGNPLEPEHQGQTHRESC